MDQRRFIVLALDPGTHCGWALADGRRLLEYGQESFDVRRGSSPGMRWIEFRRWLSEWFRTGREYAPNLIAYEQAHHRGGAATQVAYGFTTRIEEFAASQGAEYVAVHTATLKKFMTGHGRADKAAMERAALKRWALDPELPITEHEADALCVLGWAVARYSI